MDYREDVPSDEDFVNEIDELLNILKDEFPDFTFSNKINITEVETRLVNSMGIRFRLQGQACAGTAYNKGKGFSKCFDALALYIERQYRRELFLNIIRETLEAYRNPVKLPKEGKLPVIFMNYDITPVSKLIDELNGYKVGTGASLFKDFMGKMKFNENFTFIKVQKGKIY